MTTNEIKKELYKRKPKAWLQYIRKGIACYLTTLPPEEYGLDVWFEVPVSDMGDADFLCVMESQLLIRWLVVQEKSDKEQGEASNENNI